MKKLFSVIATASFLALMTVVAHAQLPGTEIRASIPFEFIVRGRTLPAGSYVITRIGDEPNDLLIRNVNDKRDRAMFETDAVYISKVHGKDQLVFHRYGDSYFLSEVLTGGEDMGRGLVPSHAERQLRREMARNQGEPETVTVALN